jgi:hypothetical protein
MFLISTAVVAAAGLIALVAVPSRAKRFSDDVAPAAAEPAPVTP